MEAPSSSETSITTDRYGAISRKICMREDLCPQTEQFEYTGICVNGNNSLMRIKHRRKNRGTTERTTDNVITIGVFLRTQPNTLTQVCSRSLCWESCEVFPVLYRSARKKKQHGQTRRYIIYMQYAYLFISRVVFASVNILKGSFQ